MSDISSKISGFGIGELGSVPATTLLDDLRAAEIKAQQTRPRGKFEMTDLNNGTHRQFDSLDALLDFSRTYVVGYMGQPSISLSAPGYHVGQITNDPDCHYDGSMFLLEWRE